MKRLIPVLSIISLLLAVTTEAIPPPPPKRSHPPRGHVVVHKGFPLKRTLPRVVVAPPRAKVKVAPALYLPPVVWTPVVVAAPPLDYCVWEDAQELTREDGWTDLTLNADTRGRKLYFAVISGAVQLGFAEVVFANGETQVVDGNDLSREPGLYTLLDFADGRHIDHVRMVARTADGTTTIALRMLK